MRHTWNRIAHLLRRLKRVSLVFIVAFLLHRGCVMGGRPHKEFRQNDTEARRASGSERVMIWVAGKVLLLNSSLCIKPASQHRPGRDATSLQSQAAPGARLPWIRLHPMTHER